MTESKKHKVRKMFDSISNRYDLLNHLLSAGIDIYWRKKALKLGGINKDTILLDVACGTGDFALEAQKAGAKNFFGADLSMNMLKFFNQKSEISKGKIVQAVAEQLPFKQNTFSHITVAFGVRNFYNIKEGFKSFHSVLGDGGKVIVLEFRLPSNKVIRNLYLFYFNKVLPFIGKVISRDKEAYTYLPESVEEFDMKVNLTELFNKAGFKTVENFSLTLGLVQVVIAYK